MPGSRSQSYRTSSSSSLGSSGAGPGTISSSSSTSATHRPGLSQQQQRHHHQQQGRGGFRAGGGGNSSGSSEAQVALLSAQVEQLRRAVAVGEERERSLEAESTALQEAGAKRVAELVAETRRLAGQLVAAQDEAADKEAKLLDQVKCVWGGGG